MDHRYSALLRQYPPTTKGRYVMCEQYFETDFCGRNSLEPPKDIDWDVKRKRTEQLLRWIEEDKDDPCLKTALCRWRDDIVQRLPRGRTNVCAIKLPHCFVEGLHLHTNRVYITPSNAVFLIETLESKRNFTSAGLQLVPRQISSHEQSTEIALGPLPD